MTERKPLERGAWVGYSVQDDGYTVRVYDHESREVETYTAGNHRLDSQGYVERGNPDRLPVSTLRRFARQTAQEMAGEYGISLPMVMEEEE